MVKESIKVNKTQTMIAALIRDRATYMVADANEELARVHLDTLISVLKTIQTLRDEAQAIAIAANKLLTPTHSRETKA